MHDHLGFTVKNWAIQNNVFIPKYYNPEINSQLDALKNTHDLLLLGDIIQQGLVKVATGDEIGKMSYDTGNIPFIRTSDISNWEIKTDPKQGVSNAIYTRYASKQDIKPGDILFVRDGTYLIGASCMVTETDTKALYQSHILKFRVLPQAPISGPLLLALLSSPLVRKQVKAKQFTADIIDSVGNRYQQLILPVPKDLEKRVRIEKDVLAVVQGRVALRERLRRIPLWCQGTIPDVSSDIPIQEEQFELTGNVGFTTTANKIYSNIFIPRYYDPLIEQDIEDLSQTHELISLGKLADEGVLHFSTGDEVGKMAYDTGKIPFIRTSDISNWELKSDPKQNLSEDIYEQYRTKQDIRAGDIFVVRDGTYLVGTSCILTEHDTKLLYCGGIYKIRVKKPKLLDPYLLLALLNCPIVRRQMRAKQFTRDVIDTLGKRLLEVIIPIPKDTNKKKNIADVTRETVETRVELRNKARWIALDIEGIKQVNDEDEELLKII